ncbi:hypothetical protein AB0D08_38495 [Kitasatospora sp. NPDC048540]|uniref:hypothetical protein n=1 Tax=Kitasatospora sp. NPDC048540 TaxID=3155634 RepID=UPI0034062FE2
MGGPAKGHRDAAAVRAGLNDRQRAFLRTIVDADRRQDPEGWVLFSLERPPAPGGPVQVMDGLRADGWSPRGARSTLRALFDRDLVGISHGLVRLPDGGLTPRVRTRALDLGRAVARAGRSDADGPSPGGA